MSLTDIRDIINGKTVEGSFDQIVEIKDAIEAYALIEQVDPCSIDDLVQVHDVMTFGQLEHGGFRECPIGVFEGDKVIYRAPEPNMVPEMISRLFEWLSTTESPAVIKAAVAHYYIESIHPFEDGNGRMGRYWHTLILTRYDKIFDMVSLESKIGQRQNEYYSSLEDCQSAEPQDCTQFIDFCLDSTISALEDLLHLKDPRIHAILTVLDDGPKTTTELMSSLKLKDRSNFRNGYLIPAMEYGFVEMTEPDKPNSPKQRYRNTFQ